MIFDKCENCPKLSHCNNNELICLSAYKKLEDENFMLDQEGRAWAESYEALKINANESIRQIKQRVKEHATPIEYICGNCDQFDGCHSCCQKDINSYNYKDRNMSACENFKLINKLRITQLANDIKCLIEAFEKGIE